MRRFILFLFLTVCFKAHSQPGLSPGELESVLDGTFEPFSAPGHPGIAVTILKDGRVAARKAYGLASIEHNVPFSHRSVVRLNYSEGREFTAIATVLMESEGLLSLEDKVRKYFPRLPAWSDPVTIRDLLNHRSGFVDEWATLLIMHNSMGNRFDEEQFLELLYRQPRPEVAPGKGYLYSNSDFGLLRLILEKASGKNLRDYAKTKIFEPLEMTATQYHDHYEIPVADFAVRYMQGPNGGFQSWLKDKTSPGGNYFIATTANDLEKWAAAQRDENSFVVRAMERLMIDPQLMPGSDKDGPNKNYVFGYKEKVIGGKRIWLHQGVNDECYLAEVPSEGISVIILGNDYGATLPYQERILRHLLNDPKKSLTNKVFERMETRYDPKTLQRYTGRYHGADTVTYQSFTRDIKYSMEILMVNDSLKWKWGNDTLGFDYIRPGVFKDSQYDIYFEFSEDDPGFVVHDHQSNSVVRFMRDTRKRWNPPAKDLQALSGHYYSPYLDYYCRIKMGDDGQLVMVRPTIPDTVLEPSAEKTFLMWMEQYPGQHFDSYVQFHADKSGKVSHFTITHNRLMGHRFDRVK